MILGIDFKFRNDIEADTVPIELLLAAYKGVVYRYQKIGIRENDDDSATLKFEFELFETGNFSKRKLKKDPRFKEILGLILNTLILEIGVTSEVPREKKPPEKVEYKFEIPKKTD